MTIQTNEQRLANVLDNAVRNILKPRPRIAGSEWANTSFTLSAETATTAGAYRWETAPYQREWLDVMCNDVDQKVVLMTSARVGKSTCMKAATAFFMEHDPTSILWMLPTLDNARAFSTTELDPMIRDVATIREKVKGKRERDSGNNILTKRYSGGVLHLVGAESAAGLHGKTIRVLFADECDRYPQSAGTDGDPLSLAQIRVTTFQHRKKQVLSSTPTLADLSVMEREFKAGDQRYYHVECPYPQCKHLQQLEWKHLSYKDSPDAPEYVCQGCGALIPEQYKLQMLLNGRWIATNPHGTHKSYHINALYSTYMSWRELVAEWVATKNNRFLLQVFVNSRLGETWQETSERVTINQLATRLEQYNAPFPTKTEDCNGAGILACGVDIQGNRIEAAVYALGANDELWLVDALIFDGDTGTDTPWLRLQEFILSARYHTLNGAPIGIRTVAIDRGYNSQRVDRFVAHIRTIDTARRTIIATRGVETGARLIADRPTQSKTTNHLYYQLGTNIAKDHLSKLMMNNPTETSGNCLHIPVSFPSGDGATRWVDNEILAQLVSEKPAVHYTKGKPIRKWVKVRERNEQWDMLILAYASLMHLGAKFVSDLPTLVDKVTTLQPVVTATPTSTDSTTMITPPSMTKRSGVRIHQPTKNRDIWR